MGSLKEEGGGGKTRRTCRLASNTQGEAKGEEGEVGFEGGCWVSGVMCQPPFRAAGGGWRRGKQQWQQKKQWLLLLWCLGRLRRRYNNC